MSDTTLFKHITLKLRHDLSPDEIREKGKELAGVHRSASEAEQRKKEQDARIKAEIEQLKTRAGSLSEQINNGYEIRETDCEERYNASARRIDVYRCDDERFVSSRDLTPLERQSTLNF
jgi:hypothetical protein